MSGAGSKGNGEWLLNRFGVSFWDDENNILAIAKGNGYNILWMYAL